MIGSPPAELIRPAAGPAIVLAVGLVLIGQLGLGFGQGLIAADLFLGLLIAWWLLVPRIDEGRRTGRSLFVPLALIGVGTAAAMTSIGFTSWAVRDLILDAGSLLTFLATLAVAASAGPRQWQLFRIALPAGLLVVLVQLLLDSGETLRTSAGFPNPNLAGHYVVTTTATCLFFARGRRQRVGIALLGGLAWLLTGSFGALLQASAMLLHQLVVRAGGQLVTAAAAVTAAGGLTALIAATVAGGLDANLGLTVAGFSTDRLGRSAAGRLTKWLDGLEVLVDQPWGVGPGSVNALGFSDNELHNEPLAYLVERGPLGLLGLVALGLVLWVRARPGGAARTLILGFAVASLFRETSHYRHLAVCLALTLAWESSRQLASSPEPMLHRPPTRLETSGVR